MSEKFISLNEKFEDAHNYWIDKLRGDLVETTLPSDYSRPGHFEKAELKFTVDERISSKLLDICKKQDMSLYVFLLSVLKVFIFKTSENLDTLVSSPVISGSARLYNNYIVLRDPLNHEMTFREALMSVKETVNHSYKNEQYPLKKLLYSLSAGKDFGWQRVSLLLESIHGNSFLDDPSLNHERDMVYCFIRNESALLCNIVFNGGLFKAETVQRLFSNYHHILRQVIDDIGIKISEIDLVTPEEKAKILYSFNDTFEQYDKVPIHRIFECQAEKTPDRIAVSLTVGSGAAAGRHIQCTDITYNELNKYANRLACLLREKGVTEGTIVGLISEPSIDMIAGILAVLKAGGAYMPLDPGFPNERIRFMLANSNAKVLLAQKQMLADKIKDLPVDTVCFEEAGILKYRDTNLEPMNKPEDIACVIYTSGSTGNPKGVMVEHRGILNFIQWRIKEYGFSSEDTTLQLISASFDGFGSNLYSSLLSGGRLVLIDAAHRLDYDYVCDVINHMKVSNISMVPSMYRTILASARHAGLKSLRFIVLAGEKTDIQSVKISNEINPGIVIINEYGPTENSITTTFYKGITPSTTAVIGKPIANHRVYILNSCNTLMPIGIPGEICAAGIGLARGYINNPALTSEKFVPDPFVPGEIMYRTGDLAKWLEDGNIEIIGRIDHQIKIKGFRIEPEEIASKIKTHPEISDAIVIDKEDKLGNKYICAYFISKIDLNAAILREFLADKLPAYMIPSYFIKLESFPLLHNGKLDRKGLPDPDMKVHTNHGFIAAETEMEKKLAEAWREVLTVDCIGSNDNFFDLGGDSILAMKLSMLLQTRGLKLEVKDLFLYPVLKDISCLVRVIED